MLSWNAEGSLEPRGVAGPTGERGGHRGRYLTQLWGGLAGLHLDLLHLMSRLLDDPTQGGTEQGVRLSILHPSICDTCHPRQASPKVSSAQSLNVIGHGGLYRAPRFPATGPGLRSVATAAECRPVSRKGGNADFPVSPRSKRWQFIHIVAKTPSRVT